MVSDNCSLISASWSIWVLMRYIEIYMYQESTILNLKMILYLQEIFKFVSRDICKIFIISTLKSKLLTLVLWYTPVIPALEYYHKFKFSPSYKWVQGQPNLNSENVSQPHNYYQKIKLFMWEYKIMHKVRGKCSIIISSYSIMWVLPNI